VVAADGTVYFGSDDGCLYAVTSDGRQKWVYPTSHPIRKSPALGSDGLVYFTSEDWYLRAVDTSGALVWDYVLALYTGSPAIAPDGVVWLTTGEGLVGITCQGQLADAPWPMYRHDLRHTACAVR
jgi:outer membrane protein assembly factor BamB